MNFENAWEYMLNLSKRGIHPGLDGVKLLCASLGNPETDLRFIHVVGTNGKGSTSLFISEMLRAAKYKVGVFSSPSVFEDLEIIKVNGRNISHADYARLVELISSKNTFGCTRFEVETAMAFLYFKEKKCDFVVLEAGMGGLLDATNVIETAEASVFTSIGMDHVDYLGDTIEKITENKAGVIKSNSLVISTFSGENVLNIIKERADRLNSDFIISDYRNAEKVSYKSQYTTFTYRGMKDLKLNLLGTYQLQNAALAIDTVLSLKNISVSEGAIRKGLEAAKEGGRFEKILDKPVFILDGAHNEPASLALRDTLETYFTKKRFIYIMGMLKDKDVETVVKNTVDLASCVFTVPTSNKVRTMSSFELAKVVKAYNPMVSSLDSADEAVEMALMMANADAKKDIVIVAFGSLSHLNDIKKAVSKRKSFKKDTHGVDYGR